MNKIFVAAMLSLMAAVLSAATLEIKPAELRDYKVGEEVTFNVTARESKDKLMTAGTFQIQVRDCNRTRLQVIDVDLSKGNPLTFKAKLNRPGFIFAAAYVYTDAAGKKHKWSVKNRQYPYGGAGVEPEKIRQSGKEPADFDKFWQDGLKAYAKAEVIVKPANDIKRKGYKVSRITVKHPDGSGAIYGFLSIPVKPGKYPAVAGVPGAGPGVVKPNCYVSSNVPAIELFMNVHPYPMAETAAKQKKLYAEYNKSFATKAYFLEYADNQDKYVYRKAWLALSRAIDYVAALPEFDGKNFAAAGNSQGGGTALAMGYLNKNITCIAASVPALCDHQALQDKRQPGWPQLYVKLRKNRPVAAPYFDCASFAARIKVPAIISAGYIDTTCSPSSVYAAYNNLKGEKVMMPMYCTAHVYTPETRKIFAEFLDKNFTRK